MRLGIALLAVTIFAGCGGRMAVRALVAVPPELPVRVFPEITVISDGPHEERVLADAIAAHLSASAGAARIERIDEAHLATRRSAGSIGPASAVIRVEARISESMRPTFVTRPQTVCTPWGCTNQPRTVMDDLPVVFAIVILTVSEGRSDRVLQELRLEESEEGGDPISMRLRVLERLRRRAIATVDPGEVELSVELHEIDDDEVRGALLALREGRSAEARSTLDRVVTRESFGARPVEARADLLFDLGQVRRLELRAGTVLGEEEREERLGAAEELIRLAMRLRPHATYARALGQIADERRARARMRALEDAASHNFALDGSAGVPQPPSGYAETVIPPP